jgi:Tfp pilus assembly PilM family ATPase
MKNGHISTEVVEAADRCTLGVHLDLEALRIAEVVHGELVNWTRVPYPNGLRPGSSGFATFLKDCINDFYPLHRRAAIWAVAPLPSMQVRFLSIPKVRPRQLSNLVYWTFRKEIPFDPVLTVFDYDVEGEVSVPGEPKRVDVTAYTVSQADVDAVTGWFRQAGLALDGLMIPSFALRNVFKLHMTGLTGTVVGLHVGDDSSSIMFVKGRHVVSHRVFKTGMNVMLDMMKDRHPDWTSEQAFRVMGEALKQDGDGSPAVSGLSAEDAARIKESIHVAFGRLFQQVERSVSAYLVGRSGEEIKAMYVSGAITAWPSLVTELGTQLGMSSRILNPLEVHQRQKTNRLPMTEEEGGGMAIALGAALSDPVTSPNLLHTYIKREQDNRVLQMRRGVTVLGSATLIIMILLYILFARMNRTTRVELEGYRKQVAEFVPYPDREMIQTLVNKAAGNSARIKRMAQRSLPMSAVHVMAGQIPDDIHLEGFSVTSTAEVKEARRVASSGASDGSSVRYHVLMDGMVLGPSASQQSKLASFILRLEDTELFEQVNLARTEVGAKDGDSVLLFGIEMSTVSLIPDDPSVIASTPGKGGKP